MGPPVTYHRSPFAVLSPTNACRPCVLSSLQGHAKREASPYDESVSAGLAIRAQARMNEYSLAIRGAHSLSHARVAEQSCLAFELPSLLPDLSCLQCVLIACYLWASRA